MVNVMYNDPISYIEPVFRPPSEAKSLILPVTNGCSWNKCTFCEMYTQEQKKFRAKKDEDILEDIKRAATLLPGTKRVFLADGDAMVLSTRRLLQILQWLKEYFPQLERVSSYCLPRNIAKKTVEDLSKMRRGGLGILYVGLESGDNEVLELVNKGETYQSSVDALKKIKASGIESSVMVLSGLGGDKLSKQHAVNSARAVNEAQPDYVSTLVVSFPTGEDRFRQGFPEFKVLTQEQLFEELYEFIDNLDLEDSVFRSDHASNYLPLKGVLGRDKQKLLHQLDLAINQPDKVLLRQEWQRGL